MASKPTRQEVSVKPTVAVLYGDAHSAAVVDALKHWRQSYAPAEPYEGLIGAAIECVQIKTRIVEGPRCIVVVGIEGKRRYSNDEYYYEASLAAGELKLEKVTD